MLKDITIGQYFPLNSPIHKLDPRIKIILTIFCVVLVFSASNIVSVLLALAGVLVVIALTKVPFKLYFKGLKAIWLIIILTSVINLFYVKGDPIFTLGFITITVQGVMQCIFIILRLISMILISSVLTYTTSPTELTDAIERLLKPLSVFKIKIHELAMMMTIALRFIPTLIEETEKIMNAQKARGADMESGNFMHKIKAMIPIFIPLFISAVRRAVDLAMAMECRCYKGGDGRTRMKVLKLKVRDFISLAIVIAMFGAIIYCNKAFSLVGGLA